MLHRTRSTTEAAKWGSSAINDKLERIGVWLIPEVEVMREKVTPQGSG